MNLRGIPILQPTPLTNDPYAPVGSAQPILQLKELEVDMVRYGEWKMSLKCHKKRKIWEDRMHTPETRTKGGPMNS